MKLVLFLLISLLLFGCYPQNENELKIINGASAGVTLNFRAEDYRIPPGDTIVITDVPNGTFTYSTIYQVPPGVDKWSVDGDAAGDQVDFSYRNTRHLIHYASAISCDDGECEYVLFATRSSTLSSGGTRLVSPE